ncbi:MAG: biotin/lipoyl-binding protein, partial [Alphaproteobacteria bacterium]|nr:biotin/lipoyl-binding protein [Alphaproteobacteria bacterium]
MTEYSYNTRPTATQIRRYLLGGCALVAALLGGMGGWAATMEIAGAVIATGTVAVDSNVKKVQHPDGGIVGEILARDGDAVAAGDILVRLDDTIARAALSIVDKRLGELRARQLRLWAERDGAKEMQAASGGTGDAALVIESERKLFALRRHAREGQRAQLRERVAQLHAEI